MPKDTSVPSYRRHRASGQAVVTISARDIYLGKFNSAASKSEYNRVIAEWLAAGRRSLQDDDAPLEVRQLVAAFYTHCKKYYRKPDGTPTSEVDAMAMALGPVRTLFGHTPAMDFGPLRLVAVQDEMVRRGWRRTQINKHVGRVRLMFRWAVKNEIVPGGMLHALNAVDGLKAGRTDAKESEPVRPVPDAHIDAVRPFLSVQVCAMIDLQLLTGARPGEICSMRTVDLDTSGKLWLYTPASHKTQHHGHARTIYLGPKAQDVLRAFLKTDMAAFIFTPAEAEKQRRERQHDARKTPLKYGNRPGTNKSRNPNRPAGDVYDVASYRRAIARACERAFEMPSDIRADKTDPPELATAKKVKRSKWRREHVWHPHQLRHSAATKLRKEFGLEAAQVILGHKSLSVTEIYAEKNVDAAMKIMSAVG